MSVETVEIVANGEKQRVSVPCTVKQFLAELHWQPGQVVVERNGEVLRKEALGTTVLSEGDRLEVIIPVAGG